MLTALQPILCQKILEWSRLRLLTRFERQRGSRTIAMIHRQKTMSFLGFPVMRYIVRELLAARMPEDKAVTLARKLSSGTWTHDYAITAEEAKSLGLPVSTNVPAEIYEFMQLIPQPTRTHPSAEYVPLPHPSGRGPPPK